MSNQKANRQEQEHSDPGLWTYRRLWILYLNSLLDPGSFTASNYRLSLSSCTASKKLIVSSIPAQNRRSAKLAWFRRFTVPPSSVLRLNQSQRAKSDPRRRPQIGKLLRFLGFHFDQRTRFAGTRVLHVVHVADKKSFPDGYSL